MVYNFDYTGNVQEITLTKGFYRLECWGAQGGYRSNSSYGGKGGYSCGVLSLDSDTKLYIYVGGSGNTGGTSGGFNGGGKRVSYVGGGGATDMRIGEDSLYARVIVAGGGGSDGASSKTGMYGGGTTGGSSTQSYGTGGYGGTQTGVSSSSWQTTAQSSSTTTQAGAYAGFGFGGNGIKRSSGYGGAGGGGWYGGSGAYPDGSGDDDRGGGGGSGYVYTASTASSYPSGCKLNSSYYLLSARTIAGNVSHPSTDGRTETGHSGNGYARITYIGEEYNPLNDYDQIEYIQSSGNQYIDTGVSAKPTLRVWVDFAYTNTSILQQRIFGATVDTNMTSLLSFDSYINGSGKYAWSCQDANGNWQNTNITATTARHTLDLDSYNSTVKIDNGTTYSTTIGTTRTKSGTNNIYLMDTNYNTSGSGYKPAYAKLYACKIYESGTIVRDYIPVIRKQDGVSGLYDKVNNTFYGSQGSTNFIAGPKILPPINPYTFRRRLLSLNKEALITTIRLDQNIADSASMITRIVDGGGIEAIRDNSHRYTGFIDGDTMILKLLDDNNGTKYVDGSTASLTTLGTDVWMKLPLFYYKAVKFSSNVWDISFAYGAKPDPNYKEWDGKTLIGVYLIYLQSSCLYSNSLKSIHFSNYSNFVNWTTNRGTGYEPLRWEHLCMMTFLFYAYYNTTDIDSILGTCITHHTNYTTTGTRDNLGMRDSSGSNIRTNFWGLEDWHNNVREVCWNTDYGTSGSTGYCTVTRRDGTTYIFTNPNIKSLYISKINIGDNLDIIPIEKSDSETALKLEFSTESRYGNGCVICKIGYNPSNINFGVWNKSWSGDGSTSTRLTYYGNYIIQ